MSAEEEVVHGEVWREDQLERVALPIGPAKSAIGELDQAIGSFRAGFQIFASDLSFRFES